MKLYIRITVLVLSLFLQQIHAQDASPSPYSFFGMGDPSFKGTVENIGMGGLRLYADSIHYSINNPASLSRLKFVSLSLGVGNKFINVSDQTDSKWLSAHGVSYFSLGIPIGKKVGVGFGLLPVSSSGYKIYRQNDQGTYTYEGKGGNTRLFLAAAYNINKNLNLGVEYQYYFGYFDHVNLWVPNNVITYTKENNQIDFTGATWKFSANYHYELSHNHFLDVGANYKLSADYKANYAKQVRLITVSSSSGEETVETLTDEQKTGLIAHPFQADFGLGYGSKNKWYMGAEYNYIGLKDFTNPYYDKNIVSYKDASVIRMGGQWTPQYNSITNYWKRATYRLGFNYKNTGMNIRGTDIKDFGITFGLGLPAIRGISRMNLGIELGQRGKITTQLVKENYINLHINLSLNDVWFIKRKIN